MDKRDKDFTQRDEWATLPEQDNVDVIVSCCTQIIIEINLVTNKFIIPF